MRASEFVVKEGVWDWLAKKGLRGREAGLKAHMAQMSRDEQIASQQINQANFEKFVRELPVAIEKAINAGLIQLPSTQTGAIATSAPTQAVPEGASIDKLSQKLRKIQEADYNLARYNPKGNIPAVTPGAPRQPKFMGMADVVDVPSKPVAIANQPVATTASGAGSSGATAASAAQPAAASQQGNLSLENFVKKYLKQLFANVRPDSSSLTAIYSLVSDFAKLYVAERKPGKQPQLGKQTLEKASQIWDAYDAVSKTTARYDPNAAKNYGGYGMHIDFPDQDVELAPDPNDPSGKYSPTSGTFKFDTTQDAWFMIKDKAGNQLPVPKEIDKQSVINRLNQMASRI